MVRQHFFEQFAKQRFQGRVVVAVQLFQGREITKALLNALGVIEAVDEGENALCSFLPGAHATKGCTSSFLRIE